MLEFIEIVKIIILGIVEGITEWLPISSTGHLILVEDLLKLNQSTAFTSTFLILIQLGAILAVVSTFFRKLNPFSKRKTPQQKQQTWQLWFKVIVGSVPAMILGLLFDDLIESKLLTPLTVAIALIVYGVAFIVLERRNKHRNEQAMTDLNEISYRQALGIGCFQALALIPGTSRSGSTILGGMLLGMKRLAIAEFTFFLAIPAMFGASTLKLIKTGWSFTFNEWILLAIGFVVALLVSLLVIRWLLNYIKKHDFQAFGWYRIVLGAIVLLSLLWR